jgi:hypothetical protein
MRRAFQHAFTAVAALVSVGGLAGCVPPTSDTTKCEPAPAATLVAIAERLVPRASLRHGFVVPAAPSGVVFVSAELHFEKDRPAKKGDVLTWARTGPSTFVSVDQNGRRNSSWPPANFDVRSRGAMRSRGCTAAHLGDVKT